VAESEWAKLTPDMTVARAEVNISERGVNPSEHGYVRSDATIHFPLYVSPPQMWEQPAQSAEPWKVKPQDPPTEAELRTALRTAIAEHEAREQELSATLEAHARAEDHRARCQRRLAKFATLDRDLAEATTRALRAGDDPDAVRNGFSDRLSERASALAEAHAAEMAAGTLLREMAEASEDAGTAARKVDTAIAK
jgi:hypothetical protein